MTCRDCGTTYEGKREDLVSSGWRPMTGVSGRYVLCKSCMENRAVVAREMAKKVYSPDKPIAWGT
jgi:hypothetical protein